MENENDILSEDIIKGNATEYYKILLIQRRYNFIEALEHFIINEKRNDIKISYFVEARLLTYFLEAGIFLKKVLKNKLADYERLEKSAMTAKTLKEYCDVHSEIDKYLYEFNILSDQSDKRGFITQLPYSKLMKNRKETEEIFED